MQTLNKHLFEIELINKVFSAKKVKPMEDKLKENLYKKYNITDNDLPAPQNNKRSIFKKPSLKTVKIGPEAGSLPPPLPPSTDST